MNSELSAVFLLVFLLAFVSGFLLWIWALIDCVNQESKEGNDRVVWLLIILLLQILGAIIYLLVRRPQRQRELEALRRQSFTDAIRSRRVSP